MDRTPARREIIGTPTSRETLRQSQYKPGPSSSTPEWRDSYRKRCKDRLSQRRERLVSRFRKISIGTESSPECSQSGGGGACEDTKLDFEDPVKLVTLSVREAMQEEWEQMKEENTEMPHLPHRKLGSPWMRAASHYSSDNLYDSEDIDSVLAVIDELTQELILEEQAMLIQYQESCVPDDLLMSGSDVLCPICQKNYLFQDARNILCLCGVQINTIHDGLTLDHVREQLELSVTQHSTACIGRPSFSLESMLGVQNIIMNCSLSQLQQ